MRRVLWRWWHQQAGEVREVTLPDAGITFPRTTFSKRHEIYPVPSMDDIYLSSGLGTWGYIEVKWLQKGASAKCRYYGA